MHKLTRLILFSFVIILGSCGNKLDEAGFKTFENTLKYKILAFDDEQKEVPNANYYLINFYFANQRDSIFWYSTDFFKDGYFYKKNSPTFPGSFERYIPQMIQGDSIVFIQNNNDVFKYFFKLPTPSFLKNNDKIFAHVTLIKALTQQEYLSYEKAVQKAKQSEQDAIQEFVASKKDSFKLNELGLYEQDLIKSTDSLVQKGQSISIKYKGNLLDGRLVDFTPDGKTFDFMFGDQEQVLPGLNQSISLMHKGQKSKFILPSQLCFGSQGSSNGSIPPNTPMIYEIEIIDIKK